VRSREACENREPGARSRPCPPVTAITVAMLIRMPSEFAMRIQLRQFTMGRLFLMFATKNPVHPVLVTFVGLFDLFSVESLDISISSASYPIEAGPVSLSVYPA
jgi:hypothetical protein